MLVFSTVSVTTQATFDNEMASRISEIEKLLKDFKSFEDSVDANGATLIQSLANKNNTLTNKAVNGVNTNAKLFDKYMSDKKTALDNSVVEAWQATEKKAAERETTLGNYNRMNSLNLTEAFWRHTIDRRYDRTKFFDTPIKILNMIMASIENHYGLEGMQDAVENLKDGSLSEEEKAIRQEKVNVLKDELYKLAQYVSSTQFHEEEKQRTEGQSGIKQIRVSKGRNLCFSVILFITIMKPVSMTTI